MRVEVRSFGWRWRIALAAVVAAVCGVAVWLIWPRAAPPRARIYRDVDVCLLTGGQGLADPQVKPVWAGMQDASLATRVRVSYLPVIGPSTRAEAQPYLQALIQRRCRAIVAIGTPQTQAVSYIAVEHPDIRFIVINTPLPGANITNIPNTDPKTLQAKISAAIRNATTN